MENASLHLLLADDDEADRLLFVEAFSELRIATVVSTVNSGVQLMERLNAEDVDLPDLIFLDLNMPGKSGLQCLKEIKDNPKLKDIFIAIYSTSDNENDMEETFHNGANIYITKPAEFNVLKLVLEKAVVTTYHCREESMKRENFFLKI